MNFKRKAGAAVLAIAAASAIAVPGVAMALTTGEITPAESATTTTTGYVDVTVGDGDADADNAVAAYFKGDMVGYFISNTDDITSYVAPGTATSNLKNLVITSDDSDVIEGFLDKSAQKDSGIFALESLYIDNDELETIDLTDATHLSLLTIMGSDLTDISGLDKVGTDVASTTPVVVDITAPDLTNLDFGDNDSMLDITLDVDFETLNMSGLDNMTALDVTACGDLESLDLTDDEDLATLHTAGTKLATLDTSDTAVASLDAAVVNIDDQYAAETVNDDDDDYNDYTFDMDSITGGYAERIMSDDSEDLAENETATNDDKKANGTSFIVTFASGEVIMDDYLDYDDGVLVVTAENAPLSIQYMNVTNDDSTTDVTYSVAFDVKTTGSRIAGTDRYDTMVELNTNKGDDDFDDVFTNEATDVVIASGAGFADALSASALAGVLNTGIVTTPVDSMTDDTIEMLDDMEEQGTAYIVGGTSAVSYAVEQQLTDLGFKIDRMAGVDRFDTAVKTQDEIQDLLATADDSETVIIASGVNYADALAISPYAYNKKASIVLVGADGTMDDNTAALFSKYKNDYSKAIIVGGTSVVSDDVIDTLKGYDMDVIRLAGADRFETNLVINDWLDRGTSDISSSDEIFAAAGYSKDDISDFNDEEINAGAGNTFDGTAYVVTGLGYADALAVAPLAGIYAGTINMVSDTNMTTVVEATDNDADTKVVGGTAAVSSDIFDAIEAL